MLGIHIWREAAREKRRCSVEGRERERGRDEGRRAVGWWLTAAVARIPYLFTRVDDDRHSETGIREWHRRTYRHEDTKQRTNKATSRKTNLIAGSCHLFFSLNSLSCFGWLVFDFFLFVSSPPIKQFSLYPDSPTRCYVMFAAPRLWRSDGPVFFFHAQVQFDKIAMLASRSSYTPGPSVSKMFA